MELLSRDLPARLARMFVPESSANVRKRVVLVVVLLPPR